MRRLARWGLLLCASPFFVYVLLTDRRMWRLLHDRGFRSYHVIATLGLLVGLYGTWQTVVRPVVTWWKTSVPIWQEVDAQITACAQTSDRTMTCNPSRPIEAGEDTPMPEAMLSSSYHLEPQGSTTVPIGIKATDYSTYAGSTDDNRNITLNATDPPLRYLTCCAAGNVETTTLLPREQVCQAYGGPVECPHEPRGPYPPLSPPSIWHPSSITIRR